jgi:hypothetical protein
MNNNAQTLLLAHQDFIKRCFVFRDKRLNTNVLASEVGIEGVTRLSAGVGQLLLSA